MVFKETSLKTLAEYILKEKRLQKTTPGKEHTLYKNSLEEALNKNIPQHTTKTNAGGGGKPDFQLYYIILFKMSSFQQEIMKHARKQESKALRRRK